MTFISGKGQWRAIPVNPMTGKYKLTRADRIKLDLSGPKLAFDTQSWASFMMALKGESPSI